MTWWMLGAGVLFFLGPLLIVGQIVMTARDHLRHRRWGATALAVSWPLGCVAMIGTLRGDMSPPLFGVPLGLLALTAWSRQDGTFRFGVGLYFAVCAAVVAIASLGEGRIDARFLPAWPVSAALLLLWRRTRMAALAVSEAAT